MVNMAQKGEVLRSRQTVRGGSSGSAWEWKAVPEDLVRGTPTSQSASVQALRAGWCV